MNTDNNEFKISADFLKKALNKKAVRDGDGVVIYRGWNNTYYGGPNEAGDAVFNDDLQGAHVFDSMEEAGKAMETFPEVIKGTCKRMLVVVHRGEIMLREDYEALEEEQIAEDRFMTDDSPFYQGLRESE